MLAALRQNHLVLLINPLIDSVLVFGCRQIVCWSNETIIFPPQKKKKKLRECKNDVVHVAVYATHSTFSPQSNVLSSILPRLTNFISLFCLFIFTCPLL